VIRAAITNIAQNLGAAIPNEAINMHTFSHLQATYFTHDALVETTPVDEVRLVQRSQAGDVHAFNLLIERSQTRLYSLCYRMLGDVDAAADTTQDVFLAAFLHLQQYHGGSFQAWLLRIATNRCYDQLRARKRRPQTSLEAVDPQGEALAHQILDPSETPEARVLRSEIAEQIQDRLQKLSPDQRLLIILRDIQGYSYEEIGAATGWSAGTIKSRLSRGRARLAAALRMDAVMST